MPQLPQPGPAPQTPVPANFPMGRIFTPDPRDRNYRAGERLRGALGAPPKLRGQRYFFPARYPRDYQTQEPEQSCTEHAAVNKLCGWPNPRPLSSLPWRQHEVYHAAQKRDGWPGEEPTYYGTSERAVADVLIDYGVIDEYWNAFTVDEVRQLLLLDSNDWRVCGPVVAGTNWYSGMLVTDTSGYVHPTGSVVGGHAWLLTGANDKTETFYGINSWRSMRLFRIRYEDFRRLLEREDGDATFLREVPYVVPKRPAAGGLLSAGGVGA